MFAQSDGRPRRDGAQAAALLILAAILSVGGYLRFAGLRWGEEQYIHPDEGHMRNTLSAIRWPDDLATYFDTHRSPLNVRNNEDRRYSYGTLPLFLVRAAGEWLDRACADEAQTLGRAVASVLLADPVEDCSPGTFTGWHSSLVGRALSAVADLATLVLIYLTGRRLYGAATGLVAAGFGAVTAFLIQQAHFFTVDSMTCLFTTLVAYSAVRASQTGRWSHFALAGLGVGLAAACKVSAAIAGLLVALAGLSRLLTYRPQEDGSRQRLGVDLSRLWPTLLWIGLAALLSLVAFRVGQPYAFEGPGFFGVRPSPEWFGRLSEIRAEQSGEIDLPSGRQWVGRLPVVFPWLNMVVWGMGLPLGVAAWVGWGVAGFELLSGVHRGRRHLVLWGWATIVFIYLAMRWVKTMRYFLPLYPILLLLAAYWLVRLVQSVSDWRRWAGAGLTAVVGLGAVLWGIAVFKIYLRPHTRIAASRWILEHVPMGATVANEHWDWGLPLRVDGHDPFGGMYTGIEMQNYNDDTPQKREQLYTWLEQSDWIFLASNRLYASIPRLPARYPLTVEYYRALFAGKLGFELEADFTSYPALGPFVFPDQENPFPLTEAHYVNQRKPIVVHLPPAEEAFSVYDHPRVLLFRKTDGFSTELVRSALDDVDLEQAQQGRSPREATAAPHQLEFGQETWDAQQAGGTWSMMFSWHALLNRFPGLAAVVWWLIVTGLGLLAFPLVYTALPRLRDRGYGFARILALLLLAYLTWLAASLRVFPNTRATILRMGGFLALVGSGVGWLNRDGLKLFFRRRWRTILLIEVLYALLFAAWTGVRLLQPDLWHPVVGGEKPMDFAYLNAVIKSTWFPPYNPWLSGTWINYYYFGFVIIGTLTKLMGTVPAIAYNLAVPLIFALTGVAAFSTAYNLSAGDNRRALLAGAAALGFTVLLGNLGVVHLIRDKLIALGEISFPSTIPGFPNTVAFFRGLWRLVFEGAGFDVRPESWYWHPTRIIPSEAGNPVAEFPAFTFLYADLHAHMIAFPLTLFAMGLALHWARASRPSWGSLLLGGLVVGALRATNTWDYPTYLLLGLTALGLGAVQRRRGREQSEPETRGQRQGMRREEPEAPAGLPHTIDPSAHLWFRLPRIGPLAWRAVVLIGLTILLYLPYLRNYVAGYNSIQLWRGGKTPLGIYLWIYALLLFPVLTRLVITLTEGAARDNGFRLVSIILLVGSLIIGVALFALGYPVALVTVPVTALAALLFVAPRLSEGEESSGDQRFLWMMAGTAMALSLAVEVVVLEGDIGRMNTVFKFYLQVWMLLSIAAAVSLGWVRRRTRWWGTNLRELWWGVMTMLILGGALFLPFGIHARAKDRIDPATGLTLDGMAFMEHAAVHDGPEGNIQEISLAGDYFAIRWMQENILGSPVTLEGLGRREYLWANRVSVYTGLPAVAGWRWHQVQQRAAVGGELVDSRREEVNACYNTTDVALAQEILNRYGVRYVYVGEYERAYYDGRGLDKFRWMVDRGVLRVVYQAEGVTLYEVVS